MAKEIVSVLKVNTADSEKTIKGLREEIKSLKTQLESAEIGSEQFAKASKDLAKAQNELKTAMNATKQTVQAADGSYDALVATMAELKKEWKSTNDEIKRSEIGQKINEINTQLKELDASIGNAQRNVGNYKGDFVDAMTEMQTGAFDFGKEMGDMNKKTEVTRTALDGVGQVASGLASGFAAVQGVTALMGIENKNLEKTLVKVQAAMAIAQGIGGMKGLVEGAGKLITAYKAVKMGSAAMATQTNVTTVAMGTTATATNVATGALHTFKAALISTGVGALVVALGTLIGYLVTLGDEAENTKGDIDDMNDSLDEFKTKMENIEYKQNWNIRFKKAGGASEEEIFEDRLENARKNYARAMSNETAMSDSLAVANRNYKANPDDETLKEKLNNAKKNYDDAVKIREDYNRQIQEIKNEQLEWEIKRDKDAVDAANEAAKKAKEDADKAKKDADKQQEQILIDLKEGKDKELAILQQAYEEKKAILEADKRSTADLDTLNKKLVDEVNKKYKEKEGEELIKSLNKGISATSSAASFAEQKVDNSYALKSFEAESPIQEIQLEIDKTLELQAIREQAFNEQMRQIQELIASKKLTGDQEEELKDQYLNIQAQKVESTENATTQIALLNKQLVEEQKLSNKELKKNIITTFTSALEGASSILSAVQEGIDTNNKEGFEKNKKLQIANATIGMMVGITNALAGAFTSKSGPWDWVLAGIQAASIATSGAIQIDNIRKQHFDGGGSAGAGVTPSINMAESMPVQYTRELLTDSETDIINQPTKVYVLEEEIQEAHTRVQVRENNASF